MATHKTETVITTKSEATKSGFVPAVVHLALDVADRGQSTAVSVLQDARTELRLAVDSGIDLAEKLVAGALRLARSSVTRVDLASAEALTGVERVLGGAVKNARETTRAAAELATTASASVTGQHASA